MAPQWAGSRDIGDAWGPALVVVVLLVCMGGNAGQQDGNPFTDREWMRMAEETS